MVADALALQQCGGEEKITLVNTVPSAMTELVRMKAIPESVRVVNLAGEALQRSLVEEIYGLGTCGNRFLIYMDHRRIRPTRRGGEWSKGKEEGRVDIGRPIAETQAYVLDEEMGLVPVGVAGELWLGGAGQARGYLNRAELTAERFVPNRYSRKGGERLYRTGDEVRWTGEGKLEFLRRKDEQVKLRGYRIELGEIEAGLREQKGIKDAVVTVSGEGNEQRLVAYVVAEGVRKGKWRQGGEEGEKSGGQG